VSGKIRFVRYGEALGELEAVIAERQRDDPLAPVTVVVPSLRIGQAIRHRLARRPRAGGCVGIANVRFATLDDLADDLGGVASRAGGRKRLTRAAIGAAARVALSGDAGFLAPVDSQPSTEAELVALYEELRQHETGTLRSLATRHDDGRELARLCLQMRDRLADDWYDDADLVGEAIRALDATPGAGVLDGPVVVHLPLRARPSECRLIGAIARRFDVVVHIGITGDRAADAPSATVAAALCEAGLEAPVGEAESADGEATPDDTIGGIERIEAADVDSEVRAALRIVLDHLAAGGPPTRVALLYPSATTYLAPLATALDSARLAWNGRSPRRVADAPAAAFLLGAAHLATEGLGREQVMSWVKSARVVGENGSPLPVAMFERISRLAGITGVDVADWHRHLGELIEDLSRRAAARDSAGSPRDPSTNGSSRAFGRLDAARALDAFITELGSVREDALECRRWEQLESWAREVLRRFLGWGDVGDASLEGADARLDAALAELGSLDSIEPAANLSKFVVALEGTLERTSDYEGRLSRGIAVWSLDHAVGLDLDLAVVLGGVEGELPRRARSSPLLSIDDRVDLGLEAATAESVSAAARHSLLAVIDSSDRTVCTWRLRDDADARARVRSRFFGHDEVPLAPSPVAALDAVAKGQLPACSESELVVATLRARRDERREVHSFHLVRDDHELESALRVVSSRVAHRFDRFDGRIGEVNERSLNKVLSPTTLEAYAECPFRYFVSAELGVDAIDEPEQRVMIDRRVRGSIVHEVLERFVSDLVAANGELAVVDTADHLTRVAHDVFAHYERLGRTGAPVIWRRQRRGLLELLENERRNDAERRRSEGRAPIALEWMFGLGDTPPVEIPIPGGSVAFRGKVDRVDRCGNGALAVVDYKTGRSSSYEGLVDDPVDGGRRLQLAIYALAARALLDQDAPVSASYRFLDEDGIEQSVVLDDALVARASAVIGTIVEGVRAGLFPFNPGAPNWRSFENCGYCDFDALCPPDRDDFSQEASESPELGAYLALVEREVDDG
jgi:ATP-dependent helicase/nuclease subunit B